MIKIIFYSLIMVSAFIVPSILMPDFISQYMSRSFFFASWITASWIAFFSLGAALIFFSFKEKKQNLPKKFLILTGISAIGFPIRVVLHNMLYAFYILFGHITVLNYLIQVLDALFFYIVIIVCPICFLIGVIGSIKLFLKKN